MGVPHKRTTITSIVFLVPYQLFFFKYMRVSLSCTVVRSRTLSPQTLQPSYSFHDDNPQFSLPFPSACMAVTDTGPQAFTRTRSRRERKRSCHQSGEMQLVVDLRSVGVWRPTHAAITHRMARLSQSGQNPIWRQFKALPGCHTDTLPRTICVRRKMPK